jgi:hypothetical protein
VKGRVSPASAVAPTPAPLPRGVPAAALAPYFSLALLVHLIGIASRFDVLAAKLPVVGPPVILMAQFPLLLLTGYFESRIEHREGVGDMPLWMRIESRPMKLALAFGLVFVCLIPLQTWNVSIGPLDPTPPASFPTAQRAMWFAMFTVGMSFPSYLIATSVMVPVLRVLTYPLRWLTPVLAVVLAIAAGLAIGVLVLSAMSSTKLGDFIASIRDPILANPALGIAISLALMAVPAAVGLIKGRSEA